MVQYALVRDIKLYIRYDRLTTAVVACAYSTIFVFQQFPELRSPKNMTWGFCEIVLMSIVFVTTAFLGHKRDQAERLPGVKAWRKMQKETPRQATIWKVTVAIAVAAFAALSLAVMSSLDRDKLVSACFGIAIAACWCQAVAEWLIPYTFELAPRPRPAE